MQYQLVPMDRSHLPALVEIENACFSTPWTEAMLAEELYNEAASFIVAEGEDGTILGYAGLQVVLDEGYIANVAVCPDYRRQGVADALLEAFIRFGKEHLAFLSLEVRDSNLPAIGLYEKYDFTVVGRRKGYYTNPREDALIMTLTFGDRAER